MLALANATQSVSTNNDSPVDDEPEIQGPRLMRFPVTLAAFMPMALKGGTAG